MRTNRILSMLLSLMLFLGGLTACGSVTADVPAAEPAEVVETPQESAAVAETQSIETEPVQEESETSAPEEPEPDAEPTKTVYSIYEAPVSFTWLAIRNVDYEQGVITDGLAENEVYQYISELLGIHIEWDLRMDASTVYPLMIAGGDYPDCWGSKLGDYYPSFDTALEEEIIISLDAYMDDYLPNYKQALLDYGLYEAAQADNGFLGVLPINTGYTQFGGQIRGDILRWCRQ